MARRRQGLVVGASVVVAAAISTVSPAVGASPATSRLGACDAHRKGATVVARGVIVYGRRAGYDAYSGGALTLYYACLRPNGARVLVGRADDGSAEYPPNEVISAVRVAGTLVGVSSGNGFASAAACARYGNTNCGTAIHWALELVDAKSRRGVHLRLETSATKLAVSSAGAAAWVLAPDGTQVLQAIVLHRGRRGQLTGAVRTLDTGSFGRSLTFTGRTLHWTRAGVAKSLTLS